MPHCPTMRHAPNGVRRKAGHTPRVDEAVASRLQPIKVSLAQNSDITTTITTTTTTTTTTTATANIIVATTAATIIISPL
eukprot:24560-Pyramimonas_sp.AAC.1